MSTWTFPRQPCFQVFPQVILYRISWWQTSSASSGCTAFQLQNRHETTKHPKRVGFRLQTEIYMYIMYIYICIYVCIYIVIFCCIYHVCHCNVYRIYNIIIKLRWPKEVLACSKTKELRGSTIMLRRLLNDSAAKLATRQSQMLRASRFATGKRKWCAAKPELSYV